MQDKRKEKKAFQLSNLSLTILLGTLSSSLQSGEYHMLISFRISVPVPSQWRGLELNTVILPQFLRAWWFSAKRTSNGKFFCSFVKFAVSFLIFKMIGESAVVIASSLYIFCSFFELKQSAGFILFHVICE